MAKFKGRLGVVQRVLPHYRAPFFDLLAAQCEGGLGLFAGQARPKEAIPPAEGLSVAEFQPARNQHILAGPLYFCRQHGLLEWLEDWKPDALVIEANPRYLSTPDAVDWMRARQRPVLGWGLGAPGASGPLAALERGWRMRFLDQFDGLLAYSQSGAEEYRAIGFPAERIFVAPNAVVKAPKGAPPTRPERLAGGRGRILFVGRLQARKRIENLIEACALLSGWAPELVVVGDGPFRGRLEEFAAYIFPDTNFTGALFGDALEAQFLAADLFVLPGSGGLAVQQAMAHGLPVVAAEGDGTQRDLVGRENGWLVPPNDVEALRVALADALSDARRLRQMGAESFRMVKEEFNMEKMAAAFVQALNAVAS